MTDTEMMIKAIWAAGPALLLALALGVASIRWSKLVPWATPPALAVGFLPVLLSKHGDGTELWRWATLGVSLFALAGGLAVTRRSTGALLLAALVMLAASVFLGMTHIERDPPRRLMLLLLGPLVACLVPMGAERPGRFAAGAMFIASAALAPCILFAGHDSMVDVYATVPAVLGVSMILALWRPSYAAGFLVAAPIMASFAIVAWNAAYEPTVWMVRSLALTGAAALPLAIPTGKRTWWIPPLLTIGLALGGAAVAFANVDLSPYGLGDPPANTYDYGD